MQDSRILQFLKSFPPWIVLTVLMVFFVLLYKITSDIAYKEWSSLVLASLFTALGVRATQPQNSGSTNSGDVLVAPPAAANPTEDISVPNGEKQ